MKKLIISTLLVFAINAQANNQVLVLSGGDDPGLNHYSQYLQTKTLYENLVDRYGDKVVSLYFGAGNNSTSQPQPLDVHKVINTKENIHDKTDLMLTGIIPNNQAATKTNVIAYFMSPRIQTMTSTETLLLFVSDHGMPYAFLEDKSAPMGNNCIDLWNYKKPFINNFSNAEDFYNACLSKNELAALLINLPAKQIVFQMSQCFSGGFHQLSVMSQKGYPTANPKICGFTAAPADHYASGCTADANGASYQGYERSFTEWFTGKSILSGEKLREPEATLFSAHQKAVLEDMTVDVPLSTSDYYLLQWADLLMGNQFKSRVANYPTAKVVKIYSDYLQYAAKIKDLDLQNFSELAHASEQNIIKLLPSAKAFAQLSLTKQADEITVLEQQIQQQGAALDLTWEGMMALYLKLIMPAWDVAINDHQVEFLSPKEYLFEKELYQPIVRKGLYKHPYQFDMYYLQYLSEKNNDPDLINYRKNRNASIIKWAQKTENQTLVNAVNYFQSLDKKQQVLQDEIANSEKEKQFLKRILTYNKIIAAWVTLNVIQDKVALNDLQGLLNCEHSN